MLLTLGCFFLIVSDALGQSGPYYGLPLGAFHYTMDSTTAEIYAADPKSVMIVNFQHNPKPGCTTFMAGPARADVREESVSPGGQGILLPIRAKLARVKRSGFNPDNFNPFAFNPWSVELDQLRVGQSPANSFDTNPASASNPFAGIELDLGNGDETLAPTTQRARTTARRTSSTSSSRSRSPWRSSSRRRPDSGSLIIFDSKGNAVNAPAAATTTRSKPKAVTTPRRTTTTTRFNPKAVTTPRRTTSRRPTKTRTTTTRRTTTRRPTRTRPTTTTTTTTTRRPTTTTTRPTTTRATTTTTKKPTTTTTTTARPIRDTRPTPRFVPAPRDKPLPNSVRQPSAAVQRRETTTQRTTPTTSTTEQPTTTYESTETTPTRRFRPAPRGKPLPNSVGRPPVRKTKPTISHSKDHDSGLIVVGEENQIKAPSNVHPRFFGPLPRSHEQLVNIWPRPPTTTSSPRPTTISYTAPTLPIDQDVTNLGGYTALFGVQPPATPAPPTRPRPQPVLTGGRPPAFGAPSAGPPGTGLVFMFGESAHQHSHENHIDNFEETTQGPTTTPTTDTTKLFYVVEDPRAGRRRYRPKPTLPPEFYRPEPTTPNLPPARFGEQYSLTEYDGQTLMVHYPDNAEITDFEWFGIYDHCIGRRTAFVATKDVRPPEETLVAGIAGWKHSVASGPITIMNCNTLLLEKFYYTGANFTDSYFYVGIGEFPNFIVQQDRAYVVGHLPEQPLRDYYGEDVMIRLPRGWKTFDLNFLSVYHPTQRVSYGHTNIPPVIVPPCEDLV